jgi:hypothetical protein
MVYRPAGYPVCLSCNPQTVSELPQAIFQSLSQETIPGRRAALTPEEGDNSFIL